VEPLGERDGRVAFYLTDHLARLRPPIAPAEDPDGPEASILAYLKQQGASFFAAIQQGIGGGFPAEIVDALWSLVWKGLVTNDTLHALRAYLRPEERRARRPKPQAGFRSRRLVPPTAEGRWSLVDVPRATKSAATEWASATAHQLLARHGVVTRETVASEAVAGGFTAVYDVLKAMEDAGRVRRGYFVAGLGAAQFAMPAALDTLRSLREPPDAPHTVTIAATDTANPYGSILKWPGAEDTAEGAAGRGPTRSAGAMVILVDGAAAGYLRRGERELLLFLPGDEPRRTQVLREVVRTLLQIAGAREPGQRGMLIGEINGRAATSHSAARVFIEHGFSAGALGLQARILGTPVATSVS
jgi:ATP-dependent Lhr-like helicase